MRTLMSLTIVILIALISPRASATLIDQGGSVTRDDVTGFDWLDLPETYAWTPGQVLTGAGGWVNSGWRIASAEEVCDLLRRYIIEGDGGFCTPWGRGVYPAPELYFLLGGQPPPSPNPGSEFKHLYGACMDAGDVAQLTLVHLLHHCCGGNFVGRMTRDGVALDADLIDGQELGTFLVRDGRVPVIHSAWGTIKILYRDATR